jgi:hypothetical protein
LEVFGIILTAVAPKSKFNLRLARLITPTRQTTSIGTSAAHPVWRASCGEVGAFLLVQRS